MVFDRNKGAIHALYTRACATSPISRAMLVLELTIGADGSIIRCEVVSSDLNDPDLERNLVSAGVCSASRPRTSAQSRYEADRLLPS